MRKDRMQQTATIELAQYPGLGQPQPTSQPQSLSIPAGCYLHGYEDGFVTLRCPVPTVEAVPEIEVAPRPSHTAATIVGVIAAVIVVAFVVLLFIGLVVAIVRSLRGSPPDGGARKGKLVAVAVVPPQGQPGDGASKVYYVDVDNGSGSGGAWAVFVVVLLFIFLIPALSVGYRGK